VVDYYNLDAIISVGYRVNSKRGTQFRQWATRRLKDYLIEGVAINEKRLEQKNKEIQVLHDGIRILSRAIENQAANNENYAWLYQFSVGLQLLDDYDHESLDAKGNHTKKAEYPAMSEYMKLVDQMRAEFNSDVFGREKDGGFDSAVNQIMQGFGEQDAYPSIEEKAAMLLYLVVKNHAFVDGNKRIAAACFLLFLERNGLLYTNARQTIISNEALASLTLFVAASKAEEMETVKKLLISVLNRNSK
jgi:death-on-curing family protein